MKRNLLSPKVKSACVVFFYRPCHIRKYAVLCHKYAVYTGDLEGPFLYRALKAMRGTGECGSQTFFDP
jgi:hypothetical protein